MSNILSKIDTAQLIKLLIALVIAALAVFIICKVFGGARRLITKPIDDIKREADALAEEKEQLRSLETDCIRVDTFTREDAHAWFDGFLKSGQRGVIMTGDALRARTDIKLPSVPRGSTLIYLSIYDAASDSTLRRRILICKKLEPELEALLSANSGSAVFEI